MKIQALALFIALTLAQTAAADILHLELGAGNYGNKRGTSDTQFEVLENTLSDLVEKYGPKGTIYLNDIDPSGVEMAISAARSWLISKKYSQIRLVPLFGDYRNIEIPKVTTAHLTHPDIRQLAHFRSKEDSRRNVSALERIAAQSKTGLQLTTYYFSKAQGWGGLFESYLNGSELISTSRKGYRYIYPTGEDPLLSERFGIANAETGVYVLKPISGICKLRYRMRQAMAQVRRGF